MITGLINIALFLIGLALTVLWKGRVFFALWLLFFYLSGGLTGCNPHHNTCWQDVYGYYHCSSHHDPHVNVSETSNIIIVEDNTPSSVMVYDTSPSHYGCAEYDALPPYYEDPAMCYYYDKVYTECDWYIGYGCYETWIWDDLHCDWSYYGDWCEG